MHMHVDMYNANPIHTHTRVYIYTAMHTYVYTVYIQGPTIGVQHALAINHWHIHLLKNPKPS